MPAKTITRMNTITGRIWILGDNIDTDLIVPSHILTEQDQKKMLGATLEAIIPDFAKNVQKGDMIIGGSNFGGGSSREEAVFLLKTLGISAIIAKSFARIFYRNCINLGLPPILCPTIDIKFPAESSIGALNERITIDFISGTITNSNTKQKINFTPFPTKLLDILQADGAIPYLLKKKSD